MRGQDARVVNLLLERGPCRVKVCPFFRVGAGVYLLGEAVVLFRQRVKLVVNRRLLLSLVCGLQLP